jgi:uncharacterized protein YdgA (DUF945 family)
MAISAFPPVGADTWTEVATSSPTTGSTVTFSALATASKFRIVGFDIIPSTSATLTLRVNNDSTQAYFTGFDVGGTPADTSAQIGFGATNFSFDLTFTAANQAIYKTASGFAPNNNDPRNNYNMTWANTAAITRFDLILSTGTFTAGTIKVFAA